MLIIRDDKNQPQASVFYAASTLDGTWADQSPGDLPVQRRPRLLQRLAADGLVRADADRDHQPAGHSAAAVPLVANNDILLDETDLVFIDAVGNGYSRPPVAI